VFNEPSHFLGGYMTRSDNEIAFILSRLVIYDHEELPLPESSEGLGNWVEPEFPYAVSIAVGVAIGVAIGGFHGHGLSSGRHRG